MLNLDVWETVARIRMGSPRPGKIVRHKTGQYADEDGIEVPRRLEITFGDSSELSCFDLGAGPAESAIAGQLLQMPWKRLIQVEAFLPYLYKLREKTICARKRHIHEGQIDTIFSAFSPGEVDIALLSDVIGFLPHREALRLLVRLERFVNRGIVLFVPAGPRALQVTNGNAYEQVRSIWQPADFARLGYTVTSYEKLNHALAPPADAFWAIKRLG